MNNFTYYNPTKMIFGKDTISQIGKQIKDQGVEKVLLLYGKGSVIKNGAYDKVVESLKNSGIQYIDFSGVKPNPVLSTVKEAIKVMKDHSVDAILALGGGSVIDSAKAAAAGFYYEGDVWDLFERKAMVNKALPIFTVLTISATGSEMNSGGVITNEAENKKWSFGSPLLYPKVSIIDPTIQFTLPENQTVNGAVDTLSHVFELYLDGTRNTDMMDELSEGIIRTMMKHVKILLKDKENYESRCEFTWSSTLALNGMNGTGRVGDWSSHQIEHSLSAFYDISHGAGLAIVFPAWMRYVQHCHVEKFERFAERIFDIKEGTPEEKGIKAIEKLKEFYKEIGAPTSLKEVGIPREDLIKLAENAALLSPLGTMKELYKEDILKILELCYE